MYAQVRSVAAILQQNNQYIIPLFQRSYSWQKVNWQRLYGDIVALMENSDQKTHFLGPLVCTSDNHTLLPGGIPVFHLIDGQQRLTTLTLILAAIRDIARERDDPALAAEIEECYLINKWQKEIARYKVLPRTGDREALVAILEQADCSSFYKLNIYQAWKFFKRQICHRARVHSVQHLRKLFETVMHRLQLVEVTISGENPYEIFESLNATGLPLAESDLIRNFVFMQIPLDQQSEFEKKEWSLVEQPFKEHFKDEASNVMTSFYRDYLMRDGNYSREKQTFVDFKDHQKMKGLNAHDQAKDLLRFVPFGVAMRIPEKSPSPGLTNVLRQITSMDIGTAYPLVLALMGRFSEKTITEDVLKQSLTDIVSFVLRRTVCNESTRSYGRLFVDAIPKLENEPLTNLRLYLSECGWPDDETVCTAFTEFSLYRREPKKTLMILQEIERSFKHKEAAPFDNLSIEHVLPQTIKDDENGLCWQKTLGSDWQDKHERYLHTLGNLTLTAYNPNLSNSAFHVKLELFKVSHVDLNVWFAQKKVWGVDEIKERTKELSSKVCALWPRSSSASGYQGVGSDITAEVDESNASKRNQEYWKAFAKVWNNNLGLIIPSTSNSVAQAIPLNEDGSIVANLWMNRKHSKLVAYIEFRRNVLELYNFMQNRKCEVDDMVEGDILWDEPQKGTFCVREDDVPLNDRDDWPLQHSWFYEELEDLVLAVRKWKQEFDNPVQTT
jgi:hypothetical protein